MTGGNAAGRCGNDRLHGDRLHGDKLRVDRWHWHRRRIPVAPEGARAGMRARLQPVGAFRSGGCAGGVDRRRLLRRGRCRTAAMARPASRRPVAGGAAVAGGPGRSGRRAGRRRSHRRGELCRSRRRGAAAGPQDLARGRHGHGQGHPGAGARWRIAGHRAVAQRPLVRHWRRRRRPVARERDRRCPGNPARGAVVAGVLGGRRGCRPSGSRLMPDCRFWTSRPGAKQPSR